MSEQHTSDIARYSNRVSGINDAGPKGRSRGFAVARILPEVMQGEMQWSSVVACDLSHQNEAWTSCSTCKMDHGQRWARSTATLLSRARVHIQWWNDDCDRQNAILDQCGCRWLLLTTIAEKDQCGIAAGSAELCQLVEIDDTVGAKRANRLTWDNNSSILIHCCISSVIFMVMIIWNPGLMASHRGMRPHHTLTLLP